MKQVTLIFPDTISMADFILIYRPQGVEPNSFYVSLKAGLGDDLITVACTEYGALPLSICPIYDEEFL